MQLLNKSANYQDNNNGENVPAQKKGSGALAAQQDIYSCDDQQKTHMQKTDLKPLSAMRISTLNKIEKAVIHLFAGHDANEVTMMQIATKANVSLQTLYKYFGDKQTVIYTILDRVLARLAARMIDHLQGIDSVQDRLRKTLWVCFDFVDNHPDAVMVLSTAVPVSRYRNIAIYENEELLSALLKVLSDGQQRHVLNDDVPLYILLDVFMGFISRLGLMHIIRQKSEPMTADFDVLFNMLWRAISKPESKLRKVEKD